MEEVMRSVPDFNTFIDRKTFTRKLPEIMQLNIGLYCNQPLLLWSSHVNSSPARTEMMDRETAERVLALIPSSPSIKTLDLTGGAPELCDSFRFLVEGASAMGLTILDRCNLTVLSEPGQEDLADFLAEHKVQIVASLPCYSADNVDVVRGKGVFERSIDGLKKLNSLGYGVEGTGLELHLVYNPNGAFLAPEQGKLEVAYKSELSQCYGITFNSLLALNNMPVNRYSEYLNRTNELEKYMNLLVDNFNEQAVDGLMCRNLFSVGWDGRIFDCDFNQQLDMPIKGQKKSQLTVFDIDSLESLAKTPISVGQHCFGCTAGCGSSCSGSTS
ncbi:radical SAM/Cys-rich domain-containing protein [Chloropicon primus]|uniref:Radical SAM/Cys-rich domain-containing protein n=1 Tax=Chloropicon primus TaxID=1764295 RepID=A0A5B8MYP0_9CHLO|nr:radical SAM/Cys-rich domain-containing protein [Chloropicon primus]UPR03971.1 radical SAM/Cys-rich domain-containing protein [Chloropicon primus]|eukprot:QDZ24765.1 radical SAM/Cys-rich domain-containing protein [Chloropicon primus]